ncbi:MAG: nucleotidyl transferase AbiEii/AbiGii toxin family protein [bacterium]
MYKEILTEKQIKLLPLIKLFSKEYYLVGGTAIALQLGHRHSVDFDLFSSNKIGRRSIENRIKSNDYPINEVIYEDVDELTMIVNSVKMTFYNYPFKIIPKLFFEGIIKMPTLLDLAAMKAYTLGRRAKWKDYVDLYFILKDHFALGKISERAREVFGNLFNEKLFREQLCYFEDINYSERIEYEHKHEIDEEAIKRSLSQIAVSPF